ncbi:small ribosomal subunit protein bS18m isoform X1 [Pseudorca crassidens]|uniref:small ribosomal subunit protein bS18m isoform X1 n=1 Tax=Pseudorca crassidens TaxID=82174 RepID=UPI00352FA519
MAAMVALCSGLGRRALKHFVTAAVCLTDSGAHAVLWRSCSQYKQVTSNEDLPVPMENPYKEPLKKCILCGKRVDYKNVQLLSQFISPFTGCIYGRHITGLCGKKQKEITKAIKRAQIMDPSRFSRDGFPGGAVVESPPADAGDTASCPSPGGSHMPRSSWAREPRPLGLHVWSLWSATGEATAVRGPRTAKKKNHLWASLVAQWLKVRLPMQGMQVRAPVREDPTCRGAAGPMSHGR